MDELFAPSRREDASLFVRQSRSVSNVASENSFVPSYRDENAYSVAGSRWRCVLRVTSPQRMRWDLVVMVLAVWNCFYVPFVSAFLTFDNGIFFTVFDLVIDVIYILDIAMNFHTTYIDEISGKEVFRMREIAMRYVSSGRFFCDIVAGIPFEVLQWIAERNNPTLQMLALVKMIRLLRLSKIIMFMRSHNHVKLAMKLLHLFLVLILYLHMQACFWFMLNSVEEKYIPPTDYVHRHTYLYHDSVLRSYSLSLYMSVYMLTAAEIGPRTEWERMFVGCCILLGQLFQAYMFGEIAVVLFNLNIKSTRISEIQDAATTSMANMRLAPALQTQIADFLVSTQGSITKQTEFEEFFKILPPSIKQDVRAFLFEKSIMAHPILSQHSEIANSILHRLSNLYCQPEFNVVTQGEKPDALYFLVTGKCEVEVLDEHKKPHRVKKLKEGALFGEVALVYNTFRTATVRTIDYANIAILKKEDFSTICHRFPKAMDLFRSEASRYHDSWKRFLKSTLRRCPYFKRISGKVLSEVIYMLPTLRVQPNTYLYKESQDATKVFFILDGKVEVYIPVNDSRLAMFPSTDMFLREQPMFVNRIQFRRGSLLALKNRENYRFLLKMAMEDLGMGSVICPNLVLVEEKVNIYFKATEMTTLMMLDLQLLKRLCVIFTDIKESVEKYRQELFVNDPYAKVRRSRAPILDYVRCFEYDGQLAKKTIWLAKHKVKSLVVNKLFTRRAARSKGVTDLLAMSKKLKVILEAETAGDFALSEKVRRGVIPSDTTNLVDAMSLLKNNEVENPLMTQFALAATDVGKVLIELKDKVYHLEHTRARNEALRKEASLALQNVLGLVKLALRFEEGGRCIQR